MSSPSQTSNARSLVAFMETITALPNRPDLRCAPHAASRAGADIVLAYPAPHASDDASADEGLTETR